MPQSSFDANDVTWLQRDGPTEGQEDYAEVHSAALASTEASSDTDLTLATNFSIGQDKTALSFKINRAGLSFSGLSAISTSTTITSAVLRLFGYSVPVPAGNAFNIVIVSGDDLASPFILADYGDLLNDTASYGSLAADYNAVNWNDLGHDITLTAAGLAAVQSVITAGTDVMRFGVRGSTDISNVEPPSDEYLSIYGITTGFKPKLTLYYGGGEGGGILSVVETRLHYVDAYGTERFILGSPVV